MTDPQSADFVMIRSRQCLGTPWARVRRVLVSPAPVSLADPTLARDTAELTRRLAVLRRRGGPYAGVGASPALARLILALEMGGHTLSMTHH